MYYYSLNSTPIAKVKIQYFTYERGTGYIIDLVDTHDTLMNKRIDRKEAFLFFDKGTKQAESLVIVSNELGLDGDSFPKGKDVHRRQINSVMI